MKFTLVLDMHFRNNRVENIKSHIKKISFPVSLSCLCMSILILLPFSSGAEVLERVVAIVDEEAILLSEFLATYEKARKNDPKITREKVLSDMVDRLLLIHQAKKFRLGGIKRVQGVSDESELVNNYIERRIKSLIHIPFEDIEDYYNKHIDEFAGAELLQVKDDIERRLVARALQLRILRHLKELRDNAYIRIQLE